MRTVTRLQVGPCSGRSRSWASIAANTHAPPGCQPDPSPTRGQREVSGVWRKKTRFTQTWKDSQETLVWSEGAQTLLKWRNGWISVDRCLDLIG